MNHPTSLTDPNKLFVVDTSITINIIASKFPIEIFKALPNRIAISSVVLDELEAGQRRGYTDVEVLEQLIKKGFVDVLPLGDIGETYFEELVVGPAIETLDDGEAATIASALEHSGVALIDERKANRICREKYPALLTACTVDIFSHPRVYSALGRKVLSLSVFNALRNARMQVMQHHIDWVVKLVGPENINECNSLSKTVRERFCSGN